MLSCIWSTTTFEFNVLWFSGSVDQAPSHSSQSGDAHCSADSICFAIFDLLDWSNEVILVVGDAC